MAITINETVDGAGLIYVGEGTVTGQELLEAIQRIRCMAEKPKRWMFCLHDFTRTEALNCSAEDIRTIASQDKNLLASILPAGFVVAVVTSKDHHYGLARMWQVYAEETKWDTGIFKSRASADQWVREKVQSTFGVEVPSLQEM